MICDDQDLILCKIMSVYVSKIDKKMLHLENLNVAFLKTTKWPTYVRSNLQGLKTTFEANYSTLRQ